MDIFQGDQRLQLQNISKYYKCSNKKKNSLKAHAACSTCFHHYNFFLPAQVFKKRQHGPFKTWDKIVLGTHCACQKYIWYIFSCILHSRRYQPPLSNLLVLQSSQLVILEKTVVICQSQEKTHVKVQVKNSLFSKMMMQDWKMSVDSRWTSRGQCTLVAWKCTAKSSRGCKLFATVVWMVLPSTVHEGQLRGLHKTPSQLGLVFKFCSLCYLQ